MSQASGMVGWEYAVWDRLDPVMAANHRWLGGYRHPRCFDEAVARELLAVFIQPQPSMDGADAVGDPLGTLPVLYHLIWRALAGFPHRSPRRRGCGSSSGAKGVTLRVSQAEHRQRKAERRGEEGVGSRRGVEEE